MQNASQATRRLLWLTAIVTLFILVIGATTLWQTLNTSTTTAKLRDSDLIASCARELRSQVDDATTWMDETDGARDAVILDGLLAVARGDEAALIEIVERGDLAQIEADLALQNLHDVNENYREQAHLSRTDPEAFIEQCNR